MTQRAEALAKAPAGQGVQAAPVKSVPAGHGAGEALGDGVAENEAVSSAPKASALKKGRYAQESLAELG